LRDQLRDPLRDCQLAQLVARPIEHVLA